MGREIGRTTEALRMTNDAKPGDEDIFATPGGRIVAVAGPQFLEYLTNYIMPIRRDTAQLALSAMLQRHDGSDELVKLAYDIADEFMLTERPTLDSVIDKYFQVYMTRDDKTEKVMRELAEDAGDYSL